jgi:glucose-1-phosphate thymidylyltransferase
MKGIILAGGTGSRLCPITIGVSKQLLPIYDKPLIHYPLATLMLAGIRDILVITTAEDQPAFQRLLGDGSGLGLGIQYAIQPKPQGIAQAFLIGKDFIGKSKVALILGDNIFHGSGLGNLLRLNLDSPGARIFGYKVGDPERYGVVEFNAAGEVISLEEKPLKPKSQFAIAGLYFYDNSVIEIASGLKPSGRGELEITSINQTYLDRGQLNLEVLPRGTVWLDTGTVESMHAATSYVKVIEDRQATKVSCIEEISWRNGWIDSQQLLNLSAAFRGNEYGKYLEGLLTN